MYLKRLFFAFTGAFSLLLTSLLPADAATLNVAGGQLIKASGVNVSGKQYDVAFVDGTCVALFDGCDQPADFLFQTSSDAAAASQALLDQVLVDGVDGLFDSDSNAIFGLENTVSGFVVTTYSASPTMVFGVVAANNFKGVDKVITGYSNSRTNNLANERAFVYAKWTLAAVPIPASLPLLAAGLGALILMRRRRRPS